MPKKPKSIGKLKKELDAIYSRYIRLLHSKNGYVSCISCGLTFPIEKMQCGHFVSRRYSNTRYDERNTKPQCIGCNLFRGGNVAAFAVALQDIYGESIIGILARQSKQLKSFTKPELGRMIQEYKEKYASLTKGL